MNAKAPNDIYGVVESSLNYSRQVLSKKGTSEVQKIAYKRIKDHFEYYLSKKVDPEFLSEMIEYHLDQSINRAEKPKTCLSYDFDKVAQKEISVLMRLAGI
jgi:hypothetical protein